MGERGVVHVFQPKYTIPDPKRPGKRIRKTSRLWLWRFSYRGLKYQGGPGKPSKTEAREVGEGRKAEVMGGLETDPRKTTFGTLEAIMLGESVLKTERTKVSVKGILARLKRFFRSEELAIHITRTRLFAYIAFATGEPHKLQLSTVKLDLKYLHGAMRVAHSDGRLLRMPEFPKISVRPRAQTFRTPDEFRQLVSYLPEWWRRFFLVADEMAWRATSELKTRLRTDVDFGAGFVLLDAESSKTRKSRIFPITDYLRGLLEEQIAYVQTVEQATGKIIPWLFCNPAGRPLGSHKDPWKRACKKAGFQKLDGRTGPWSGARVVHDIRRTALRRWDFLMLPLGARMGAAGHESQGTHEGYLGADPEALRAMAKRLDEDRVRRAGEAEKVVQLDLFKAKR